MFAQTAANRHPSHEEGVEGKEQEKEAERKGIRQANVIQSIFEIDEIMATETSKGINTEYLL